MNFTVKHKDPKVFTVYQVLACGIIDEEMKYLSTIDLPAGVTTSVTTTLIAEPYNVFLLDSAGRDITATVTIDVNLVGGVYVITIFTSVDLTSVKLKILY
jgi:hypothetical protein